MLNEWIFLLVKLHQEESVFLCACNTIKLPLGALKLLKASFAEAKHQTTHATVATG